MTDAPAVSPAISIVIPHLNQPEHLVRCLAALAAQRDAPTREVIVVDNGSREMPEAVCAAAGATLLREGTPGPGPARNRGVAAARAPILAFIDADCIADPGWLAAIARRFEDPAAEILGGDVRIWREDPARATMLECYESIYAYRMQEYIERQGFTGTGNLAVRRGVLDAVGPFAGIDVAEDRDWGRRATAAGRRIAFAPDMKAFHPARRSFAELFDKWSRQIGHDRAAIGPGAAARAKWLARAAALLASPLAEAWTVATTDRVRGGRERALAFAALCRIRAFRARVMVQIALGADGEALARGWNRG